MSEQLIQLLSLCVLVLLYLFFFRVMRAMWSSVATPRAHLSWRSLRGRRGDESSHGGAAAQPATLVVRSPLNAQGERHVLSDELTIGRSPDCDVIIDDGYSSQTHARLYLNGSQHLLEDLGSTNGTYLNRQKVASATAVRLGDFVQIGSTVFEVST